MNYMKQRTLFTGVLTPLVLVLSLTTTACDQLTGSDSDDSDANAAAALLLGYAALQQNNPTASRNAAQVRGSVSAVSSSVSNAASGGSVTFRHLPIGDRHKMLATLQKKLVQHNFDRKARPNILLTALSKSGGTCNSSGCATTLSGSENCKQGDTNSGTFTTTNLQVAFTFSGDPMNGDFGYSGTMKGDMKMNKCQSTTPDYFNFPSMTSSVTTGDINYDGSQTQTLANVSITGGGTGSTMDITVKETSTTKSSNLAINGGAAQVVNVTQVVNLTVNSVASNISTTSSSSEFTFKASYVDTLTGTVAVTGTVGGGNVNVSRTYNKDKFTYDVDCKIKITDGSGDCTVTVK